MIQQSMVLQGIVINRILLGVGVVWAICGFLIGYISSRMKTSASIEYMEWMFIKHVGRLAMTLFIAGLFALIALLMKVLFFTEEIKWY